eukprot:COSAG04_NODE_598_length_12236_cov_8.196342_5_plen_49_part_00
MGQRGAGVGAHREVSESPASAPMSAVRLGVEETQSLPKHLQRQPIGSL